MHLDFKVDAPATKAYIILPQTDQKRKKKCPTKQMSGKAMMTKMMKGKRKRDFALILEEVLLMVVATVVLASVKTSESISK